MNTECGDKRRNNGDDDDRAAEFALAVRTDQQRRGIGRGMMRLLLDYAAACGFERVWGLVEIENDRMLALARQLGFRAEGVADHGEVRVGISLSSGQGSYSPSASG